MFERSKKAASKMKRLIAVAAVPALSVLALSMTPHPTDADAYALYVVSNDSIVHVDDLGGEVFLTDSSAELVSRRSGNDLTLSAGQPVTVSYQGNPITSVTRNETVSQLLERLEIVPSPLEMVSVSFLDEALEISVNSEFVFYEHISDVLEHETVYQYNSSKPAGEETVIQEGSDGSYTEVYEVVYQDGEETARQLINALDVPPVSTIIEVGTKEKSASGSATSVDKNSDGSGTITLSSGETLSFRSVRTMRGTAYTRGGKVGSVTASGTNVHVGVVAVDKNVIPLGTRVYVVSNDGQYEYGYAVAEDTGVRGNSIDLYMDTKSECTQFGVRQCTVYILD